ncbi:AzlC family ABC transporter permease [Profundibacter amoris]|uniref:Branched-chain amino acid ABC transporter permease n=1 Tax=Profundibacter amoris TaxID=2171755 RepID=A0A347UJY2_9RHOB|nr:AzlC family ABC transporter permease [Profundibacter amoris]AXX99160.1 branched-chain amino acid ABC transporter permease [Profundibacter amoris]
MTTTKRAFLQGIRDSLPFIVVVAPFAMLFGVVATEAGLSPLQTFGFSVAVIAGAAQFAAVQLMADNAPVLIIVATALAVNLRMAMYSASIAPYLRGVPFWQRAFMSYMLVDQSYAQGLLKYETEPDLTPSARVAYFFGTMMLNMPLWYGGTLVGALLGNRIPQDYALDFAVPITFLALVGPMLKTAAHVAAAFTSVLLTLVLAFLPYNLGLMVAALVAMMVGAQVELMVERRRA